MTTEAGWSDDRTWFVRGEIIRWVDDEPQPGIVECQLTDSSQNVWSFIRKFYDFTTEDIAPDSSYPREGFIACSIVSRSLNETGREIVLIDTVAPFRGRISEDGTSRFSVFFEQLVLHALPKWELVPLRPIPPSP